MTFESFWEKVTNILRNELQESPNKEGLVDIPNWSKDDRIRRKIIPVKEIGGEYIVCLTADGKDKRVWKRSFQFLYDYWDDYNSGNKLRKDLMAQDYYTTYTIAITKYIKDKIRA